MEDPEYEVALDEDEVAAVRDTVVDAAGGDSEDENEGDAALVGGADGVVPAVEAKEARLGDRIMELSIEVDVGDWDVAVEDVANTTVEREAELPLVAEVPDTVVCVADITLIDGVEFERDERVKELLRVDINCT